MDDEKCTDDLLAYLEICCILSTTMFALPCCKYPVAVVLVLLWRSEPAL